MAEIPLTEVFDVPTRTLLDNYHDVICDSVLQQLQDTTWLSEDLIPSLTDSGFGMYHARDRNHVILLQKPALQRLINQRLKDRSRPSDFVHVPVLIRFLMPAIDIPIPPGSSVASDSVHESRSRHSRRGPPSVIDPSVRVDTPPVLAATKEDQTPPSVGLGTNDDPANAPGPFEDNRSTPDPPVATDHRWPLVAFRALPTQFRLVRYSTPQRQLVPER